MQKMSLSNFKKIGTRRLIRKRILHFLEFLKLDIMKKAKIQ